jgi:hypothetical protein
MQTSPEGYFRPVGTESFGRTCARPRAFDQQPVEAAATISACVSAWHVDRSKEWTWEAVRAFEWFLGSNDLHEPLVDLDTGSCRDGLHADRPNENRGAESTLSYLLGLIEIRKFKRLLAMDCQPSQSPHHSRVKIHAVTPYTKPGGPVVSIPVLESPGAAPSPRSSPGRRQTI